MSCQRAGCTTAENGARIFLSGAGQLKTGEHNDGAAAVIIRPAKNILGSLRLPGDKSISHRYAMLAAIAGGTTRLANFSTGADCASSLECVQQLGCTVRRNDSALVEIEGRERLR
jgi:5-enolpyruvylshikimate-3-phosphate synthase